MHCRGAVNSSFRGLGPDAAGVGLPSRGTCSPLFSPANKETARTAHATARPLLQLPDWVYDLSPLEHVPRLPVADFTVVPLIALTAVG